MVHGGDSLCYIDAQGELVVVTQSEHLQSYRESSGESRGSHDAFCEKEEF